MNRKSTARDMTSGNIIIQLSLFALPLLIGNIFQLLYNTVDTIVVGNYVGTQALAAVGSTTMIVNILVFFFNGFSIGATVVIGQNYGAKNMKELHNSIETTMMLTFVMSIIFTVIGVSFVSPMLKLMSTPEDVIPQATVYLRIYFAGISGLLIYNMASGILRAVGDTTRPLYFLMLTSVMNIFLDLFFVLVLKLGIAGVGLATILSQFVSAILCILLLTKTEDIYRFTWHDMHIDSRIFMRIVTIGLPTAIQSTITSLSNVLVQSYINTFGSDVMAGWSCYNKLDMFIMIPMQSMANSATTFVSQNIGARQVKRANQGTITAITMSLMITGAAVAALMIFAAPASRIISKDEAVVYYSARFIKVNVVFLLCNCINHTLAGALRGRGDSKGPMIIMITCFVVIRQIYLFIATRYFANTPSVVGFGYPVGWMSCCIVEVTYFLLRWGKKNPDSMLSE